MLIQRYVGLVKICIENLPILLEELLLIGLPVVFNDPIDAFNVDAVTLIKVRRPH